VGIIALFVSSMWITAGGRFVVLVLTGISVVISDMETIMWARVLWVVFWGIIGFWAVNLLYCLWTNYGEYKELMRSWGWKR